MPSHKVSPNRIGDTACRLIKFQLNKQNTMYCFLPEAMKGQHNQQPRMLLTYI
jgi:hypothetical protein